ncbi:hypothetical protein SHI21_18970 [Bacteriovorax sp. PP10]|uniref:GYF domain-containing protein n=1 Tax=Bacteriovorax antarcticus TaxID=3088717 RepID=A0ABU5W267_9BACT|nr:hypothetical protein [Bacteriovorax sp. PP10]MEA9358325.1 hypothetical protein [Bacteriovorax sp. PP10]
MANNQAVLVTYLKDILFSEEEIVKSVEREHIFEMKDKEDTSLGFIAVYDLKAYVFENEDEAGEYSVRNIDSTDWAPVFSHPFFQRRKPQLVPLSGLAQDNDQQYFILKNGQKTGPFEKFELLSMLEEKEILLTDMVTTNAGHTWMKLFQVENFDRRVLKESDQLPGVPAQAVMNTNDSVNINNPETEAISSLAYLSNVKRGKSVERDKVETYRADTTVQNSSSSLYKWLLVGSILGIGYFGFHIKNQLNSPFKSEAPVIGEQAEMLNPVEISGRTPPQTNPSATRQLGEKRNFNQVNDTARSGKFEQRVLQPIKPVARKSFMDTSKYQNTRNDAPPAEDPNYFYDNTSAMELDPVRAQVSKENYDNSAAEGEGPIPSNDNLFEGEVSN